MTAKCPNCGEKRPWHVFDNAGECPNCEKSISELLDIAGEGDGVAV